MGRSPGKGTSGTWCIPKESGALWDTGRMAGGSIGVLVPASPIRDPCLSSTGSRPSLGSPPPFRDLSA
ncbi:UNVERIFIED_CONTAM: hypothetical protein K2H54_043142 [Gekko kuhli]